MIDPPPPRGNRRFFCWNTALHWHSGEQTAQVALSNKPKIFRFLFPQVPNTAGHLSNGTRIFQSDNAFNQPEFLGGLGLITLLLSENFRVQQLLTGCRHP
jgi:hypothetical protein